MLFFLVLDEVLQMWFLLYKLGALIHPYYYAAQSHCFHQQSYNAALAHNRYRYRYIAYTIAAVFNQPDAGITA